LGKHSLLHTRVFGSMSSRQFLLYLADSQRDGIAWHIVLASWSIILDATGWIGNISVAKERDGMGRIWWNLT
jgi:hypothetical protein